MSTIHEIYAMPIIFGKLVIDKVNKRLGTWNVQTLLQRGKLENLTIAMERMKLNVLGISEMRWPRSRDFWSRSHRIIYTRTIDKICPV